MSSYYDTILKRVESEMEKGDFAEAMKLLEEELSMPYIPKEDEERIITKYNLCRSELRAQEKPRRSAVEDIGDLLRGSIDEQFQAVEQLRKSNIRNYADEVREALHAVRSDWVKGWPPLAVWGHSCCGCFSAALGSRWTQASPSPAICTPSCWWPGSWFWRQSACWWPGPFCLRTERTHPSFPQASPWLPPGCSLRR